MARGSATQNSTRELLASALTVLRKKAKKSSEEGMLELQPKGGLIAFLAEQLKVSGYVATKLAKQLRTDKLVEIRNQGPRAPRLILVKAEGEPKSRRGRPPRSKAATTPRKPSRRRASTRKPSSRRRPTPAPAVTPAPIDPFEQLRQAVAAQTSQLEARAVAAETRVAELEAKLDKAKEALS
jgi:hypothetical protein